MKYPVSVSLVLPLFNEADCVKLAIPKAVAALRELDYELIVVDDASTDGSLTCVQEFAEKNPRIRFFRHAQNRGLGAAVRTGLDVATKDVVVYADSDLPFDFSVLPRLLSLMSHADIVHGYRLGGRESLRRAFYSWIYNFLVRSLFRIKIRDVSFSLDIIRRPVLRDLALRFEAGFFATELLTKACYFGCRVVQVPVLYTPRILGRSRLSSFSNIFKSLGELCRNYRGIRAFRKKRGIRKLIVNADDFGLTLEVNRGVVRSHTEGIVTSASLMPSGRAFDDAAALAREYPNLGIGVHLCLTQESPVLPRGRVRTLVDVDGRFFSGWRTFFVRFLLGRIDRNEIIAEWEAQIQKAIQAGIVPSYLDSHQHVHLYPALADTLIDLAVKYKIPFIRCPKRFRGVRASGFWGAMKAALLSALSPGLRSKCERGGVAFPDDLWGVSMSGRLDREQLSRCLDSLENGVSELLCHPGEAGSGLYADWHYQWEREMKALIDPSVCEKARQLHIELVNYRTVYES